MTYSLNWSMILYSSINLSDNLCDATMLSFIQLEFKPLMAGLVQRVQSSCLQDLPPQN